MKYGEHESVYFRDTIVYSIGELGIHRLGYFLAINAGLWSAICILIAGPVLDARLALLVELVAEHARSGIRTASLRLEHADGSWRASTRSTPRSRCDGPLGGRAAAAARLQPAHPAAASTRIWLGRIGETQVVPDLSRRHRHPVAGLRLHRHRDHRAQHVGLGGLEPHPVHQDAAVPVARAAAGEIRADDLPAAATRAAGG